MCLIHKWKKFKDSFEMKDRVRICKKCGLVKIRLFYDGVGWGKLRVGTLEEARPFIKYVLRENTKDFLEKRNTEIFKGITTAQKERDKALKFLDRMYEECFALKKVSPIETENVWDTLKKKWGIQ